MWLSDVYNTDRTITNLFNTLERHIVLSKVLQSNYLRCPHLALVLISIHTHLHIHVYCINCTPYAEIMTVFVSRAILCTVYLTVSVNILTVSGTFGNNTSIRFLVTVNDTWADPPGWVRLLNCFCFWRCVCGFVHVCVRLVLNVGV